jgi:hypothetical protein
MAMTVGLVFQDDRAVGRDREVLEVHVGHRCLPCEQGVLLQNLARVGIKQHDLVRPREDNPAVV